ncbi:Hypothetical predicted protein [Mytilus galloprovincialis]|uniref:Uncharacterized protein n=1 Tax=Mytilus galloprovincialis TaxID=29158 RepID=A0A8B6BGN9_MYTGA|nr:Hypothetical predicted protein [Mytilus galloprovincialis]
MIDTLGGPQRVKYVLSTLNLPPILLENLKVMERRSGEMIEGFANLSMDQRCREAFEAEKSNAVEDENGTENILDTNTDSHTDMTDTYYNNSLFNNSQISFHPIVNSYHVPGFQGLMKDACVMASDDLGHDYHAVEYYKSLVEQHIRTQIEIEPEKMSVFRMVVMHSSNQKDRSVFYENSCI